MDGPGNTRMVAVVTEDHKVETESVECAHCDVMGGTIQSPANALPTGKRLSEPNRSDVHKQVNNGERKPRW